MLTKSDLTKQHILETVAPIFNKNGYAATSLSDITKATGLTKGAIYGHFENKEKLAISAFKHNVKKLLTLIKQHVADYNSPIQKLFGVTDFYRDYYKVSKSCGGCPVLNVGVDANNQNTELLKIVRVVIERIQDTIATIIENGIKAKEISIEINAMSYAKRIDSMIQGAIFMAYTMDDDYYLQDAMNQIDAMITKELKI